MICFIYSQVQYIYHAENDKVSLMLYFTLLKMTFFPTRMSKSKKVFLYYQYFLLNDSEEILKWQIYELSLEYYLKWLTNFLISKTYIFI